MQSQILITEDDSFIREGLEEILKKEGYKPETAADISEAEEKLSLYNFDLVILDIMLPDGSGTELCRKIRENSNVPVLFLTALDDEMQIVEGLDAGGDDYVTKPFRLFELLSRIRALLRRRNNNSSVSRDIIIDFENLTVKKEGKKLFLTPTELQILNSLIKNKGIIVTRNSLLSAIWDEGGSYIDDNTLSVHISRLREKVGAGHIETVRGVGYRWLE